MSPKNIFLSIFLPPLALALAGATSAQAAGLYIGGGAYQADSDVGDDTVPGGFLGYTFLDTNFIMLSAEVGYYDLGDSSNRNTKAEASAITAGGVVSLPLGPFFELYAKAGVASAEVKLETSEKKSDKTSEEAYYGVGASIDILDTIDIYVEYLVFDTSINSEVAGVGVKLSF
jgi:opacity protein-like surface antigen